MNGLPLRILTPMLVNTRLPADKADKFVAMEDYVSASISRTLDSYRKNRDAASEQLFSTLYGTD